MEKTSLSVLVPAYNEEVLIAESLKRLCILEECPYLEKLQIIVVNDGSQDNTARVVRGFIETQISDRIEWLFIDRKKNGGKGKAVQEALKRASGAIRTSGIMKREA